MWYFYIYKYQHDTYELFINKRDLLGLFLFHILLFFFNWFVYLGRSTYFFVMRLNCQLLKCVEILKMLKCKIWNNNVQQSKWRFFSFYSDGIHLTSKNVATWFHEWLRHVITFRSFLSSCSDENIESRFSTITESVWRPRAETGLTCCL